MRSGTRKSAPAERAKNASSEVSLTVIFALNLFGLSCIAVGGGAGNIPRRASRYARASAGSSASTWPKNLRR